MAADCDEAINDGSSDDIRPVVQSVVTSVEERAASEWEIPIIDLRIYWEVFEFGVFIEKGRSWGAM